LIKHSELSSMMCVALAAPRGPAVGARPRAAPTHYGSEAINAYLNSKFVTQVGL